MYSTISKLRVLSEGHHLIRIDKEKIVDDYPTLIDINNFVDKTSDSIVIFSDYDKGLIEYIFSEHPSFIKDLRNKNNIVIVDPKGSNFNKYQYASIITPNLGEFESIVGKCKDQRDFEIKAEKLRAKLNIDNLIVTRSSEGLTIFSDNFVKSFKATRHDVVDVTGAGDTVIAFLALSLSKGMSVVESAERANIAAGIAVTRLGCAHITEEDMK